jgi:hypothetical protein
MVTKGSVIFSSGSGDRHERTGTLYGRPSPGSQASFRPEQRPRVVGGERTTARSSGLAGRSSPAGPHPTQRGRLGGSEDLEVEFLVKLRQLPINGIPNGAYAVAANSPTATRITGLNYSDL